MIELYRPVDCELCEDVEAALKEMVLAHRVITVEEEQTPEALPASTPLPALKDNGQVITGETEIKAHLRELAKMAFQWRKYQSDSCYVHEDDGFC